MYSVYLSNKVNGNYERDLIFTDKYSSDITAMIDPTLSIESGTAGSFDFTLPVTNCGYNKINPMTTEVIVVKNDEEVWRGRVLNPECDFYNQMKVETEGELTYLNDTYQPQHEYKTDTLRQVIEGILSIHNNKVGTYDSETETWTPNSSEPIDKIFYVGACFVSDDQQDPTGTDKSYRATDYDTTLNCLKKIADTYKGYFIIRRENGKRYLDFVKDFTLTCNQRIDFGINLLDYSKSFKMEDLCTVAMPIGGKVQDTDFTEADEMYIYRTEDGRPDPGQEFNVLDEYGVLQYDPNVTDGQAGVVYFNEYGLHADSEKPDKVYLTTRMYPTGDEARMVWAMCDGAGTIYETKTAATSGITDITKEEIKLDHPGADRLRVAYRGGAQPFKVYKQKAESQLDEYFTIAPYANVDDDDFKHIPGDVYLIYKPLYEKYGWHEKKLEFGNLEKSEELWNMATYWLTHTQFEQMTLELTALDLAMYSDSYDKIWINMNVPIYSKPHGLTDNGFSLPCTKMTIKLNNPENTQYTLGYTTPSKISDTQSNVNADISKLLDEVPTYSSTFKSIQENATQIINTMGSVGAVTFIHDDPQNPNQITSIVISDTQDPDTATSQWKWSMGGFGYRKKDPQTGEWGAYDTAITMTGTIMGQFIAAESIHGDRIRGGTLTLGNVGLPNDDGKIEVKDSLGNNMLTIDKDYGMSSYGASAWSRVRDGVIYGNSYNNPDPLNYDNQDVSGTINFWNSYGGVVGIDVRTREFGINSRGLWVSDDLDGIPYVGQTITVTVDGKDLRFVKGILVDVTQNNNGGE